MYAYEGPFWCPFCPVDLVEHFVAKLEVVLLQHYLEQCLSNLWWERWFQVATVVQLLYASLYAPCVWYSTGFSHLVKSMHVCGRVMVSSICVMVLGYLT